MKDWKIKKGKEVIGKFWENYKGRRWWNKKLDIWNESGVIGGREIEKGYSNGIFIKIEKIYKEIMIGKRKRKNFEVEEKFEELRKKL